MNDSAGNLSNEPPAPIADEGFSERVATRAAGLERRRIFVRIVLGLVITVAAAPLREYALTVSELVVTALVALPPGLLSVLLAPINSVGAVLAFALFVLRLFYRRFFA